jgi:hypothetical protein
MNSQQAIVPVSLDQLALENQFYGTSGSRYSMRIPGAEVGTRPRSSEVTVVAGANARRPGGRGCASSSAGQWARSGAPQGGSVRRHVRAGGIPPPGRTMHGGPSPQVRVAALVCLDAVVPKTGTTICTLRPTDIRIFLERAATGDGFLVAPNPASEFDTKESAHWKYIDSKTTAHPLACFTQAIQLTGRADQVRRRLYVYAEGGICDGSYEIYRADPQAAVISVQHSGHSIMIDQPARVAEILAAFDSL